MKKQLEYLLLEFLFLALVILDVVLFWHSSLLSTVFALLIVFSAFLFFHKKEDIIFYVVGAVLGPLAEIICTRYGVWHHSHSLFLGIPLWLPIIWGFVFVLTRRLRDAVFSLEHFEAHYKQHPELKNPKIMLVYDFFMYAFLILFTLLLFKHNLLLSLILGLLLIISMLKFHTASDIFFIITAGILGGIAELVFVGAGAWSYSSPYLFTIPLWMPIAYSIFALIVRRTSVTVVNLLFHKKEQ